MSFEEKNSSTSNESVEESTQGSENVDDGTMSLTAHLEELRSRLIKSVLAVVVGSIISYFFLDEITHYLTLHVGKLYYMKPGEAFFTYIKISITGNGIDYNRLSVLVAVLEKRAYMMVGSQDIY